MIWWFLRSWKICQTFFSHDVFAMKNAINISFFFFERNFIVNNFNRMGKKVENLKKI